MKYECTKLAGKPKESYLFLGVFEDLNTSKLPAEYQKIVKTAAKSLSEEYDSIWHCNEMGGGVFIINCGKEKEYTSAKLTKTLKIIADNIFSRKLNQAILSIPQVSGRTQDWQAQEIILQLESKRYQFLDYKTNKKQHSLENIQIDITIASEDTIKNAVDIASGIKLARDLGNTPANICTPAYLADKAIDLSKEYSSVSTKIINHQEMKKLGMGAILAVGQGSSEPPKMVEIQYNGAKDAKPVVLIGKGITFDSGGISIKPAVGMEEMKYDMCGAASVLGTIKAAAMLKLPINVVGILACAENMPSGSAIKPGDIVASFSGQTIEITNTDAEGRLVLADALTYVKKFDPKFVIDIATLTGAVIIALGHESTGLMANDDELADIILKASLDSQDKVWRLPLEDYLQQMLESPVADMVNSPAERIAGSIVAGSFLSKFSKDYRWAHLDIAGTAWNSGKNRCATGRPVPLLVQLLRNLAYED